MESVVAAVKPRLRGWLHLGMVPLACGRHRAHRPVSQDRRSLAAVAFSVAAVLSETSAVYHRGNWSPPGGRRARADGPLQHLPHHRRQLHALRARTAGGPGADDAAHRVARCAPGVLFRVFWVGAPRWLYTPGLRRARVGRGVLPRPAPEVRRPGHRRPDRRRGLLYTVGAVVYGIKRPNPSPRWFGFHEIFHALTVAAFTVHYIAAAMTIQPPGIDLA